MFKGVFRKRFLIPVLSVILLIGIITQNSVIAQGTTMELDANIASMTEKRTFHAKFKLPKKVDVNDLSWTYDGKPLSEFEQFQDMQPSDKSFITVDNVKLKNKEVSADITFDLPYGMDNLSIPRFQYRSLIGTYQLAALVGKEVIAQAPIKLTPYESYHSYDELKNKIDEIEVEAAQKNDRYIETSSIGKSIEGRDIYFTIVAKDKATVDKYQNVTHPAMLENPKKLQEDIESGEFGDYKVPIWINNIHADEVSAIDAILKFFESMAIDETIIYDTVLPDGEKSKVTLNVDAALEDTFFLFAYTNNPDGMVYNSRANMNGFDPNRDNSFQTQPETQRVTEQIAKWSPLTFLDMHGFDANFLIEPSTPPHDPNLEYDLMIDYMLEQAKAMGEAGIANTKYDYYHIPYEEYAKTQQNPDYISRGTAFGWEDASPVYTAVYAMYHGAMGHTVEIPEMNEESVKAAYYVISAATDYVIGKKDELFINQLKRYERGVDNIDDPAVDSYLVNGKNEVIGRPREKNEKFFPEYYVLPIDKSIQKNELEVYRMIEYLLRNGVNIEQSTKAVTCKGITYPIGSYVVNMHQAKHGIPNMLLYDGIDTSDFEWVSGEIVQNFAQMRGFDRYVVREPGLFTGKTTPVISVTIPGTQLPKDSPYVVIRNSNNDAIKAVNKLLSDGKAVTLLSENGKNYQSGDFAVAYNDLDPLASKYYLDVQAIGNDRPKGKNLEPYTILALGEVGYVLENLGFNITDEQPNADILVNTFDSDGYVSQGKPYIAMGNMGLQNVESWITDFAYEGPGWERREGLFLANLLPSHPVTAGYNKEEYLYAGSGNYITSVPKNAKVIATYSGRDDALKAGWWPGYEEVQENILAFTYKDENKDLTVFANELTNNDHPQYQYRLLANAIFNIEPK